MKVSTEQVAKSTAFQAIAASQALELLAEKSGRPYEELFECFVAGEQQLVEYVARAVVNAAKVTAAALSA